jgi:uncharacterized protein (TIGR03083 family)
MPPGPDPDLAALYRDGRERVLNLARALSAGQEQLPVPACPGWSVKDVYAHLAGVADDALAGRLEGRGTDPWTARQVAARRDRGLGDVCEEWTRTGPMLDGRVGPGTPPQLIVDLCTHEQDIRGALERPGGRRAPQVRFSLEVLVGAFDRGWDAAHPAVTVVADSGRWALGAGAPVATLTASDFELFRAFMGRRSRRQFLALGWTGDGAPFVDDLHAFTLPSEDLVE